MISRKSSILGLFVGLVLAILYFFLFTAWGVHTFDEVLFGDRETMAHAPTEYPTRIDGFKPINHTIELPPAVKQPSGIDFDPKKNTFYILTDQAEIIELTNNFQQIKSTVTISRKPLLFRQGSVESGDYYRDRLYIGGDLGTVEIWEKKANKWKKVGAVVPEKKQGLNAGAEALAIDPGTGDLYIGKDDVITVLNQEGKLLADIRLQMTAKDGRSASEYTIAGMDFYQGVLYVLTEYHSAILMVKPSTGEIDSVYALERITEGAGLAVTDEFFYVVVDHELNQVSPGVKVYAR